MFDKLRKVWKELDGGLEAQMNDAISEVEHHFVALQSEIAGLQGQIAHLQSQVDALKPAS